jgi:glycosyltransferase involved in cell wall biosynthesis
MTFINLVICTHNPNPLKLSRTLQSVSVDSSIPGIRKLIIDNASINDQQVRKVGKRHGFEYVREDKIGLSQARLRAFQELQDGMFIFLDDDNILDSNYISIAYQFHLANPNVLAFGGKVSTNSMPRTAWQNEVLQFLGIRDLGDSLSIVPTSYSWQPEEPIGAGICISPRLAERMRILSDEEKECFLKLGRKGASLMSGEDGFICRIMFPIGQLAYVPELKVDHEFDLNRTKIRYLVRLMFNYGRSDFFLRDFAGSHFDSTLEVKPTFKAKDFFFYLGNFSPMSFLNSLRVAGYFFQSFKSHKINRVA